MWYYSWVVFIPYTWCGEKMSSISFLVHSQSSNEVSKYLEGVSYRLLFFYLNLKRVMKVWRSKRWVLPCYSLDNKELTEIKHLAKHSNKITVYKRLLLLKFSKCRIFQDVVRADIFWIMFFFHKSNNTNHHIDAN